MQAGKKTQTTRLKDPRVKVGGVYSVRRSWYKKENFGKIRILSKERTTLAHYTRADLRREGYAEKEAFIEALERINNEKISLRTPVWKVIFQYMTS